MTTDPKFGPVAVLFLFIAIFLSIGYIKTLSCLLGLYLLIPLIVYNVPSILHHLIFMEKVKWISGNDYFEPKKYGYQQGTNFYIKSEEDGSNIGAWHLKPKSWTTSKTSGSASYPIVIYCHGNMGTRAINHRLELYDILTDLDYHVIAIDYRGYADSGKNHRVTESSMVKDCIDTFNWVERNPNFGLNYRIYLWGHSLGTGVVSHAASKLGSSSQLKGVVLEAPFTNMKEEVMNTNLTKIYSFIPKIELLLTNNLPEIDAEFKTDLHILNVKVPILILHSKRDAVVPPKLGKKLYEHGKFNRPSAYGAINFQLFESCSFWDDHSYICRSPKLPKIVQEFIET